MARGDVHGDTVNDPDDGISDPIKVAKKSYDANYMEIQKRSMQDATIADLKRGFMEVDEE